MILFSFLHNSVQAWEDHPLVFSPFTLSSRGTPYSELEQPACWAHTRLAIPSLSLPWGFPLFGKNIVSGNVFRKNIFIFLSSLKKFSFWFGKLFSSGNLKVLCLCHHFTAFQKFHTALKPSEKSAPYSFPHWDCWRMSLYNRCWNIIMSSSNM